MLTMSNTNIPLILAQTYSLIQSGNAAQAWRNLTPFGTVEAEGRISSSLEDPYIGRLTAGAVTAIDACREGASVQFDVAVINANGQDEWRKYVLDLPAEAAAYI